MQLYINISKYDAVGAPELVRFETWKNFSINLANSISISFVDEESLLVGKTFSNLRNIFWTWSEGSYDTSCYHRSQLNYFSFHLLPTMITCNVLIWSRCLDLLDLVSHRAPWWGQNCFYSYRHPTVPWYEGFLLVMWWYVRLMSLRTNFLEFDHKGIASKSWQPRRLGRNYGLRGPPPHCKKKTLSLTQRSKYDRKNLRPVIGLRWW